MSKIVIRQLVVAAVMGGLLLGLTGCMSAPFMPPMGAFTQVKAPLSVDYDKAPIGAKRGESAAIAILGLVATGDASVQTAAEAGGIKTIAHVDYEYLNVLGIFQQVKVVVYGD